MNIVLLSGGSGKRLWPLSNDIRSKQFIKIFKKEDNDILIQQVFEGDEIEPRFYGRNEVKYGSG